MRRLLATAVAAAAMLAGGPARASCPSSEPVLSDLTCSSTVAGRVSYTGTSNLGGTCASGKCYTCGTPYADLTQTRNEDVYSFTCERAGSVTLDISGLDCDLDIYVLDST